MSRHIRAIAVGIIGVQQLACASSKAPQSSDDVDASVVAPSDARRALDSVDAARLTNVNRLLRESEHEVYECQTPRGDVMFRRSTISSGDDGTRVFFEPVHDSGSDETSCTNPTVTDVSAQQTCVFYDDPRGRWRLDLGVLEDMVELPRELTQTITYADDCENYSLQEGVTVGMCQAPRTCKRLFAPQVARFYEDAQDAVYACEVAAGTLETTLYFRYAYGSENASQDYLYFYPVSHGGVNEGACTDSTATSVSGIQRCVFYQTPNRWSLYLGRPSELTELPRSTTQGIANNYDCENFDLQSGITIEMCQATYTCTLLGARPIIPR